MGSVAAHAVSHVHHPVHVHIDVARGERNRLTVAFRLIISVPHFLLVGAPAVAAWTWSNMGNGVTDHDWSIGGGALGAVAVVCAIIGWFAILFTGRYPKGLRRLVTFYLRWRVRAAAYAALLRDEYPPFGDGPYPARLELDPPPIERNRLTVAFRPILLIPQLLVIWFLGLVWGLVTVFAWFAILFMGEYPHSMYHFAVGVLRWTTRVEGYALLLHDEYPPFSFDNS